MKEKLLVIGLIIQSSFLLSSCDKWRNLIHAEGGMQGAETTVNKAEDVWTCPMHPQIREKAPGSCPICGMSLVKAQTLAAEASSHTDSSQMPEGHAAFSLSLQRSQMIGVKVSSVVKKPVFKPVEAAGRIAFDPELFSAQSEYIEALSQQEQVKESALVNVKNSASRMVESSKNKLRLLGLSDAQIVALRKPGAEAPSLLPEHGEQLWVYAEIFEMDLPLIKTGMSAKISGDALGKNSVPGKVIAIDRVMNPATRTAKVRIQLVGRGIQLRPESYVDVSILVPLGKQTVVPFDAVLDTGKEAWVFVVQGEGYFEPRLVTIAERVGNDVVISSGVKDGEQIVTSANFLIDSESRLRDVQSAGHEISPGAKDELKDNETSSPHLPPKCPGGQIWHQEMKHCMPEPGK